MDEVEMQDISDSDRVEAVAEIIAPPPISVMGFDYGTKRIGVAIGQTLTRTARPLAIITIHPPVFPWDKIDALLIEWRPVVLVVGLPQYSDGSYNSISQAARTFSQQLQQRSHLPVHLIDETLSSIEATQRMQPTGRKQKTRVDAVAAQIILETWLTEHRDI
jgi:putative holliday junction resolvase